jgi:hypothetical protein
VSGPSISDSDASYEGLLAGLDMNVPVGDSSTLLSAGFGLHSIRGARTVLDGEKDAALGIGWLAHLGCRQRVGRIEWSLDIALARYALELGSQAASSNAVQALVGFGLPLL